MQTFSHVTRKGRGTSRVDREGAAGQVEGNLGEAGFPETKKRAFAEDTVLNASHPQPSQKWCCEEARMLFVLCLASGQPLV